MEVITRLNRLLCWPSSSDRGYLNTRIVFQTVEHKELKLQGHIISPSMSTGAGVEEYEDGESLQWEVSAL